MSTQETKVAGNSTPDNPAENPRYPKSPKRCRMMDFPGDNHETNESLTISILASGGLALGIWTLPAFAQGGKPTG